MSDPRLVFAANRRIGVRALEMLREADWQPVLIVLPRGRKADCNEEMKAVWPDVPVIEGMAFRSPEGIEQIAAVKPDYFLSVHFPYIVPSEVLDLPSIGALNLHPAYLPYNRGWHTPSWAIIEGTMYGATLHWMDDGIDTGDIALQSAIEPHAEDTAHSLYQRVLNLEAELFRQAIPTMRSCSLPRIPQVGSGTSHSKEDLAAVQKLDPDERLSVRELLDRLRALTTNDPQEAAYIETERGLVSVRVALDLRHVKA